MNDDLNASVTTAKPETDLEALSDGLQSRFVLTKAASILDLMRTAGTTPQAVGLFEHYWPHINKAWGRACDSSHDEIRLLTLDFVRIVAPMLVVAGERELLHERVEAALDAAEQLGDDRLRAIARYFVALSAMQTRNYSAALPLLESVSDSFPDGHADPTPIDVLTALGASYAGLGREEEAGKAFEEASKKVLLRSFSFPFTPENLEQLQAESLNRMFSGTGLVALLARPPKAVQALGPQGSASFFRFPKKPDS